MLKFAPEPYRLPCLPVLVTPCFCIPAYSGPSAHTQKRGSPARPDVHPPRQLAKRAQPFSQKFRDVALRQPRSKRKVQERHCIRRPLCYGRHFQDRVSPTPLRYHEERPYLSPVGSEVGDIQPEGQSDSSRGCFVGCVFFRSECSFVSSLKSNRREVNPIIRTQLKR
jgi:hypothetical protein